MPSPPTLPPTVIPAIREPNWQALSHDLNWMGLWSSPSSAVALEVARLESRLHNPAVVDHLDLIATKSRLAAYEWLRDTVTAQAEKANQREVATLTEATAPRRFGWRRATADSVLPPALG